ncbi:MGMT family protein [Vibrio sp. S4M6]|uniref:MGMT family protein n=1 Tax=Vibrio sinus TaxID=2946865 RepID=UPI00202A0270|nr:MGMT family protein [Vibrio sinus]MCL9781795.1 MGMT family protein [Vibrio sinus]
MDQFLQQIMLVISQIPQGKVTTYGEVARMAGYPGYARHVGKALSKMPRDSKLPWFRVINSQGKISLKGEAASRQRKLLEQEEVNISENGRIRLKQYRWHPE